MTSTNNITWQGIFTPTADTEDWTNNFTLKTSYTDTAGNTGTAETSENYMVDDNDPSVDNFTISDTLLTIGETMAVTLVFSEAVCTDSSVCGSNVFSSAADITVPDLDNGTTPGTLSTMTSDNNDNETWRGTFTPATNAEDNSSRLSLGTSYTDLAGNNGPDNQTENFEIDTLAPTVSVAITGEEGIQNSFLNAGDNVSVTATFSEAVIVDNSSGNPTITLVVGSDNRTATYTSGDNSTALVFRYTIKATGTSGENDDDGISIPQHALALDNGTIKDLAGNNATLTHSLVSDNSSVKVDTTLPTVSVAITGEDGIQNSFLNAGDNVSVTATFSETVIVDNSSGNPTITLVVGSDNRTATYTSGDNSTRLVFRYMIKATGTSGENDDDGISIPQHALALDNGTIKDLAGNNATLTHSAVDNNSSYKVDTTLPTGSSVAITSAECIQNSRLHAGAKVSPTATFFQNVPVTNTPQLTLAVGDDNQTATYASRSVGRRAGEERYIR